MFITVLLIRAKKCKQPKCPPNGEWIKKMWYIHTMECGPAIKRNEVLIHTPTWMKDENIMLSGKKSQKRSHFMIPFI